LEQQEFYLLIVRHFNGQTTIEEEAFLTAWIAENRQEYTELQEMWTASDKVTDNEVIAAGLKNVKLKIAASRSKVKYAVAAAITAAILIAGSFFFYRTNDKYIETGTIAGQVLHLHLPDGTLVHLAPHSKICYPEKFGREITLEGEAFFEVSKESHQPFTVKAGKLAVHVLGTRFNVSDTAVSLVDGKVQVVVQEKGFVLNPGQQLCYNEKKNRCYTKEYDVDDVTGWASAKLVFRNETFALAAAKIEKMYDVKIVFSDPETANYRLFAKFENKPLTYVLDMIKASDNLDYTIKGKIVYISKTN
jgi:transmembrane sensor